MIAYCAIDYLYVHFDPIYTTWAQLLFLPLYVAGVLFANRGLFPNVRPVQSRWFAISVVSLAIAMVGGYVLFTLGIWFHFAIGGTL